jgi:hypothetical protein
MDPFVVVTAAIAGVGSLVGLLVAVGVRARASADTCRRELRQSLWG